MGADNSRKRDDPLRDYSGVEMQQGKVLLDADWNEQAAIVDRRLRAAASDILGRATVSSTTPDAFLIDVAGRTFTIGRGRMYVDGLLAENHGTGEPDFDDLLAEPRFKDPMPYDGQTRYWPKPDPLPETDGPHLVYLDVWQREVTPLERADLVEVAVGVDTTTRVQTVWQVRVLADVGAAVTCLSPDAELPAAWKALIAPSAGRLSTGTAPVEVEHDPCELPPAGGYRGLENQLYRVEIHDGGPVGSATFKWSRDNASIGSAVTEFISAGELRLASLGRDAVLRFNTGDWVEILDDVREFSQRPGGMQRPGEMRKIVVDEDARTIAFVPDLPADMRLAAVTPEAQRAELQSRHFRVRRWDQGGAVRDVDGNLVADLDAAGSSGVIEVPDAGVEIHLERGVKVSFALAAVDGRFRPGDGWVFAARTADATVEILDRAPPRGVHHHYARLAVVKFPGVRIADCRGHWPPRQDGCCTVTVGDGIHCVGDFASLQQAIDSIASGTVCVRPGVYRLSETVQIRNKQITIKGCGNKQITTKESGKKAEIIAPYGKEAFRIVGGRVGLEALAIECESPRAALTASAVYRLQVQGCEISNHTRAGKDVLYPVLWVADGRDIVVADNKFLGSPCVTVQARGVSITGNELRRGGVSVCEGSSDVVVERNTIGSDDVLHPGFGAGILLGGLAEGMSLLDQAAGLRGVRIERNEIRGMTASGLTTSAQVDEDLDLGEADAVTIAGNHIAGCAMLGIDPTFDRDATGGIVLRHANRVDIRDNLIENNGTAVDTAACGIFLRDCASAEVMSNRIAGNGSPSRTLLRVADFSGFAPGVQNNPLVVDDVRFTLFNAAGQPVANCEIVELSNVPPRGLVCAPRTEIVLPAAARNAWLAIAAPSLQQPVRFTALAQGSDTPVATAELSRLGAVELSGANSITRIVIEVPAAAARAVALLQVRYGEPGFQAGIAAFDVQGDEGTGTTAAARIHDNTVVCPRGQALVASGLGSISVAGNHLVSHGERRQPPVVARSATGVIDFEEWQLGILTELARCVFVLDMGLSPNIASATPGFGLLSTMRAASRRVEVRPGIVAQPLLSDGRLLFQGNQVTLQFQVEGKLAPASAIVFSMDDALVQGNQFVANLVEGSLFVDAFALAPTLRVAANRFSETAWRCIYSCFALGALTVTADNQATHCIVSLGALNADRDNQTVLCNLQAIVVGDNVHVVARS